jgi:aspartate kinase
VIVLKFGGSSVDGAAGIERVVALVRERLPRRPAVVVSAMAKTTRRLVDAAQAAATGDLGGARAIAAEIHGFHLREAHAVTPEGSLEAVFAEHFDDLGRALAKIAEAGALRPSDEDRVAGCGELLSSALLAQALCQAGIDAIHVDCRRVIVTDDRFTQARPDYPETDARLQAALQPILAASGVPVLGGYVGATREGVPTTLGKEGSDFSAAIVGAALGADEVQIWTDVDGILTADPRLIPGARVVPTLSFGEALELARSGSKKPHPGTIEPARRADVPIRILNSRNPTAVGTLIGRRAPGTPPRILSIACRTTAHLLFTPEAPGSPASLAPGRALVSLVSDDLATHPELAARARATARGYGNEPRLVPGEGEEAAAPAVRFEIDEADATRVLAELHEKLIRPEDWT